ncbi:MAG: tetratricopeptide repeat protein, partial [Pyrinomonadaceae bacterium]
MQARRLLSKVLYFHGRVYFEQDDLKNAMEFYTRSMKLCEETGSKADLLYNLYDLAPLYIRTGDYQKAKEVAQKSLSLSLDLEGSKETSALAARVKANAWEHLGFLTAIGGDDTLGLEYLQKALSLSMKLDAGVSQKAITAGILIDIGQVYHLISEYKQALNYYAQAMKIAQNLNNKTSYARVLTKLSALYEEQGDALKANRYMERSLELATTTTDKKVLIRTLIKVGSDNQREGKYEAATKNFQHALEMAEAYGEADLIFLAQKALGMIAQTQGRYGLTQQIYDKALKIAEQKNDKGQKVELYWKKANVYWLGKDYARALMYATVTLKLAREIHSNNFTTLALGLKGKVYLAQKEYALAKEALSESIA